MADSPYLKRPKNNYFFLSTETAKDKSGMLLRVLFSAVLCAASLAHTVSNRDSIKKQLSARDTHPTSLIDGIVQGLSIDDQDFLYEHLNELKKYNATRCKQCHHKVSYAQLMISQFPEKEHLVSLVLYKYCLYQNPTKGDSACQMNDFFIHTNTQTRASVPGTNGPDAAYQSETSIDFFDNDFLQMIKNFNTSSELSLNYYCNYRGSYCPLPEMPDLASIIDLESMWPEKEEEYYYEPQYNETRERFNVLHLSDLHNQLRYQIGAEANCSQYLCCMPDSYNSALTDDKYNFTSVYKGIGAQDPMDLSFYPDAHYDENDNYVAGDYHDLPKHRGWNNVWSPASTYGAYKCDTPEVLLNNSLLHVSSTFDENKYEFSIFTGDIVDHDLAHCDANTTRYAEIRSFKIMKHYLKGLPVYPVLGNHDTFPFGQLAPQKLGNVTLDDSVYHWNEKLMSELWLSNGWINDDQKEKLQQHYAGFTITTKRNLKVISLNSNTYYYYNLYGFGNMENDPDMYGQWQFLVDELVESEKNGQRVWIIAHVPSGAADAFAIQSAIFAKIVERFSPYTIANIFYGHTHKDQFKVLYSNKLEPVNMAWISQAITPLGLANPSWRYYEVEDESFNIINTYNYYTPLNETWVNGGKEPNWLFEYNPRTTYDTNGTWPASAPLNATFWDKYVVQRLKDKLEVDFNLLYSSLIFRHYPYVASCANGTQVSNSCYQDNYCNVIGFDVNDYFDCAKNI